MACDAVHGWRRLFWTRSDGDGVDDCVELAAGLNPELADSDGDGESDGDEVAVVPMGSIPTNMLCVVGCGMIRAIWCPLNYEGDVIANIVLIDQCEEEVSLWILPRNITFSG